MFWLFLVSSLSLQHPFSVEITKENVFDIIGKNKHVFVHFWADGCRHCMAFAPEWNELVRIYHNVDEVVLATINCDRWNNLCVSFDGTSTPGIQHFEPRARKGEQFGGERSVMGLARWVRKITNVDPLTKPKSLLFSTPAELKTILDGDEDGEVPWLLLTVDDPRKQFYNQTEIRNCEEERENVVVRALSSTHYQNDAEKVCDKEKHCIVLTDGKVKFTYKGEIETQLILDFVDSHVPQSEL